MRKTGRRTLAGIAAGAIGAALIPFVGVGVSQAAFVSGGIAAASAGNNYVVTAGVAPASTAISVTAGATVTLNFSVTGNSTSATSTIEVLNGNTPVTLTKSAGDANFVQTDADTITVTETNGTTTASATFTAPAAGAANWTVNFSSNLLTDAAITSVANGVRSATVTAPTASRAGTDATYATAFTTTIANEGLCVDAISTPLGATFTPVGTGRQQTPGAQTANITIAGSSISQPGTYALAFYGRASDAANNTTCPALTTQTVLATSNLVVGAAVAAIAVAPATASAATGEAATYAVQATDSAGRPTLFGAANNSTTPAMPAQSYTLSSNSSTATLAAGSATSAAGGTVSGATAATFTASNSAATTTTITVTPNSGASAATATLSTTSTINATAVTIVAPIVGAANTNANVPTGSSQVTFRITAASAGTVGYAISGTGATAAVGTVTIPASLSADVTVPVTSSTTGRTVILATTGTAITRTATFQAPTLNGSSIVAPSAVVAAVGGTVTLTGAVVDQYENPVANAAISAVVTQSSGTPSQPAGVVTNSQGAFTLTWSAASVTSSSITQGVTITASALGTSQSTSSIPVSFNASGSATLSDLTLAGLTPAAFASTTQVPFGGFVDDEVTGAAGNVGNAIDLAVTSSTTGVNVTYSSTTGLFTTSNPSTPRLWSVGDSSLTVPSNTAVWFYSTKTGANTISVTAGGNTLTASVTVSTPASAARTITVTPAAASISTSQVGVVRVKVTDVFGNPVPGVTSTATSNLGASVSGVGLLNGSNVSIPTLTVTDAAGETAFTYISTVAGTGTITVAGTDSNPAASPANSQFGAGNTAGLINGTAVAGAPAGVASATAVFTVGSTEKSLLIAGYRSGGSVVVEGEATGFARGDTVNIRVKYYNANKKKYSSWRGAGSAVVKGSGDFVSSISTDKQVKVKVNGGGVVSNIVTVK